MDRWIVRACGFVYMVVCETCETYIQDQLTRTSIHKHNPHPDTSFDKARALDGDRLKWGVGKLIVRAPKPPVVVPVYHTGGVFSSNILTQA